MRQRDPMTNDLTRSQPRGPAPPNDTQPTGKLVKQHKRLQLNVSPTPPADYSVLYLNATVLLDADRWFDDHHCFYNGIGPEIPNPGFGIVNDTTPWKFSDDQDRATCHFRPSDLDRVFDSPIDIWRHCNASAPGSRGVGNATTVLR